MGDISVVENYIAKSEKEIQHLKGHKRLFGDNPFHGYTAKKAFREKYNNTFFLECIGEKQEQIRLWLEASRCLKEELRKLKLLIVGKLLQGDNREK